MLFSFSYNFHLRILFFLFFFCFFCYTTQTKEEKAARETAARERAAAVLFESDIIARVEAAENKRTKDLGGGDVYYGQMEGGATPVPDEPMVLEFWAINLVPYNCARLEKGVDCNLPDNFHPADNLSPASNSGDAWDEMVRHFENGMLRTGSVFDHAKQSLDSTVRSMTDLESGIIVETYEFLVFLSEERNKAFGLDREHNDDVNDLLDGFFSYLTVADNEQNSALGNKQQTDTSLEFKLSNRARRKFRFHQFRFHHQPYLFYIFQIHLIEHKEDDEKDDEETLSFFCVGNNLCSFTVHSFHFLLPPTQLILQFRRCSFLLLTDNLFFCLFFVFSSLH